MSSTISAGTTAGSSLAFSGDTSGSLQLQTNGTTTAVTIDTSQNVGIGTSSPSRLLSLVGGNIGFQENATTRSLVWGTTDSSAKAVINGLEGASGYLSLGTTSTERMRIDSSGNIGMGLSNPTSPLNLLTGQNFTGGFNLRNTNGSSWEFVTGGDNKLYMGYAASGTPGAVGNFATNGTYTATSDVRKKKDISYIFNGLEIVNALKPAQGRMLEDDDTSPLRPMFIAQDMVDVIPALVSNLEPTPSDDPLLGVDYASITPILVKAIQEQQALIIQLQADVAALKGVK